MWCFQDRECHVGEHPGQRQVRRMGKGQQVAGSQVSATFASWLLIFHKADLQTQRSPPCTPVRDNLAIAQSGFNSAILLPLPPNYRHAPSLPDIKFHLVRSKSQTQLSGQEPAFPVQPQQNKL